MRTASIVTIVLGALILLPATYLVVVNLATGFPFSSYAMLVIFQVAALGVIASGIVTLVGASRASRKQSQ